MLSCIDDQDSELHESGDNGCDSGTDRSNGRKTEVTVDQKPVADKVNKDRSSRDANIGTFG